MGIFGKNKYIIKQENVDYLIVDYPGTIKGSRQKYYVIDKKTKELAMFKYQGAGYECSEACSEKMCYEIAKILEYQCAKIELAKDIKGNIGVLNYLFINKKEEEHMDVVGYLNIHNEDRPKYYRISNIKARLDQLDKSLFNDFIKIMIFDALVGETDRHEENWGIIKNKDGYRLAPLYDNGCNLLREFKNEKFAQKFYNGIKSFEAHIKKSKTIIYKEDDSKQYKHFELIEYLNSLYNKEVQEEIRNLSKLTEIIIENIVEKVPNELLTQKHREYIIKYLLERKRILQEIK